MVDKKSMLESIRSHLADKFGVTMTDTHLTIRSKEGIANFVLNGVTNWNSDECYMCGDPHTDGKPVVLHLDRGEILDAVIFICSDCRCPK